LLLQPKVLLQQPNVLLIELNILLLKQNIFVIPILTDGFVGITKPVIPCCETYAVLKQYLYAMFSSYTQHYSLTENF